MKSSQFRVLISQRARRTLLRWIKFNAVGGIGIGVQLAALAILRSWLRLDYLPATGLAVEIAVIHNFLWHERFTWADRPAARPVFLWSGSRSSTPAMERFPSSGTWC